MGLMTFGLAIPDQAAQLEASARRAAIGEAGLRRDIQYGEDLANLQAQEAQRSAQTLTQEPGLPTGMAIPTAQAAQPAPAAAPAAAPKAGLQATMPPAASAAAAQTDKLRAASRRAAKQQGEQAWPELGAGTDMLTYPLRLGAAVGARLFPGQSDEEHRVAATRQSGVIEKTAADQRAAAAIQNVLRREGGFANVAGDRGGATNFGISQAAYPNLDVSKLTQEQAAQIYKRDYWDAIGADRLPENIRELAFDAAVNQGVNWTKQALAQAGGDPGTFLQLRAQRYQQIAQADPSQQKFLQGWMNRLRDVAGSAQQPAAGIPTQQANAPAAPQFAPVAMPGGYMGLPPREMAVAQQRLQQIQAMFNATRDPAQRQALMGQYQQLQDSIYETQLMGAAQRASAGDEQSLSSLAQAAQQYIVRTGDGRYALATQDRATGQFVPNPNQVGTAQEVAQYLLNQASTTRRAAAQALATKQQEELIKAQGAGARAAAELPSQIRLEQARLNNAIQQELVKAEAMGRRPANVVALKDNAGNTTGAIIVYNDGSYKQVGGGEQTTDGGMRVVQ